MNDRFKFRVYNRIVKEFTYFDEPILCAGDESGLLFQVSKDSSLYMCNYSEIQQCTGRKDRNGKDIYENDIVEFTHSTNIKCRGVIKFLKEEAMFAVIYKHPESKKEDWDFMSRFTLNVIGNIYTTPELLEAQNGKY